MERPAPSPAGAPPPRGPGDHPFWCLVLLALLAWQGCLTLSLFGPERPWERLGDGEPIVAGRHPLHLYHGHLGARALLNRGTPCCYDPNFQAGYPKTAVFDSGSRPAELFLLPVGGAYCPAAYKIGLAICYLLLPLVLAGAARGAGLSRAASCLAAAVGLLVWWGDPGRAALEAGQLDLLLASLAALLQAGLLVRFDRAPGVGGWLGILVSGYFGWFAHPLFFALGLPLALVYYLSIGARHRLAWHLALLVGLAGAVASNFFWLSEWASYWWIRAPINLEPQLLAHRTFHTLWDAGFWGAPADRALAVVLIAAGLLGVWRLNQGGRRPAARVLGLGAVGFLVLAVAGAVWEPLGRFGTPVLVVPALLFAAVPAAHAAEGAFVLTARWTGGRLRAAAVLAVLLLAAGALGRDWLATFADRAGGTTPLAVGLGPARLAVAEALRTQTTGEARILWEDRAGPPGAPRWGPLLPLLTGRAFVGGLDPDATIDHAYAGFADQVLAGRPLADWSDPELLEFCRRYNVGWVVCWSPAAVARFRAWSAAAEVATLEDQGTGRLFRVDRAPSYALRGKARWLHADCDHIALGDVVPEDGEVVLSLHFQAGMQVSPQRVQLERVLDADDPIPFVRLRVPGPVARVTLTWEGR